MRWIAAGGVVVVSNGFRAVALLTSRRHKAAQASAPHPTARKSFRPGWRRPSLAPKAHRRPDRPIHDPPPRQLNLSAAQKEGVERHALRASADAGARGQGMGVLRNVTDLKKRSERFWL
jgi:hypothetical protein